VETGAPLNVGVGGGGTETQKSRVQTDNHLQDVGQLYFSRCRIQEKRSNLQEEGGQKPPHAHK